MSTTQILAPTQLSTAVANVMLDMFNEENNIVLMSEQEIDYELDEIMGSLVVSDEAIEVFDETLYCKSFADYSAIEKYVVSHRLFNGYMSIKETICTAVFFAGKEARDSLFKVLCEELTEAKRTAFKETSPLPDEINSLINSYL